LQRELKNIESRDLHLWKDNSQKMAALMETVTRMREQAKARQSEVTDKLNAVHQMVTENEFKLSSLSKQVEMLQSYTPGGPPSGLAMNDPQCSQKYPVGLGGNANLGNEVQTSLYKFERDSEVKLLKDMIADERSKREN